MSYFSALLTQEIYSDFLFTVTSTGLDITATLMFPALPVLGTFGGLTVLRINHLTF